MKRLLLVLFLLLTFCSSSFAVDELDATKPANSALISTYPGYLRETRATVNEIIESLNQAYIGTNGSYGYIGVANSGKITWSSAAPTDGTWSVGDVCFNTDSTTENDYWICSVAGTPGTWRRSDYSDTLSNTELTNFVLLSEVKRNINQADETYGRSTTATNVTASTTSSVFDSGDALLLTSVTSTNSYLLGYTTLLSGLSAGYYTFVFDLNVISATTATVATSTSGNSYTTTLAQGHHIVSIPFYFDGSTNTNCSVVVSTPSAGTQCSIETIRVLSGVKSVSTINTLILASSVPASGTWLKGDKAFSTADSRGMWACTAGGTPGTWVVANGDVSKVGTPTNHQVGIWTGDGTLKGLSVTGSKVMCTDANGEPVACTNLTDTNYPSPVGVIKSNGTTFSAAVAGTDYTNIKNVRSIGEWSGDLDAAVAALDVAGNSGEDFVIVIDQATSMSAAVDLSSLSNAASITLLPLNPAGVITTGGNALTLAQQIPLSVDWQIFNATANTDVVNSTRVTVRPEWWYDGGGNYLDAFNYAWKSISTSGGALYAPGSYAVDLSSGQITPQSNTTLYGDGDSSVITYTYTGSYARLDACGMQFNDQSNVTIRDIKFAGGGEDYTGTINVDNYPPSAIAVAPSSDGAVADITIDNVTFYGFTQSGIIPSGYSKDPARYPRYRTKRFHVRNSHFIDIGQHAVAMENFTDSSVVGCDFNNVGQTTIVAGGGSGLAVDVSAGCDHIIVKNNIVDDCGGGFKSTSHSLPGIKFFKTTDNGATYTDYSTQVLGVGTADISSLDTLANGDWIVVGAPAPFQSIYFDITAANSNTTVLTAQYWNGSAWTSVNNLEDNTAIYRRKAFAKDGTLFFDKPSDWAKNTVNSVEYYWIRLSVSDALSASVTIDTMYIPELNNDVKFISNTVRNFKEKDGFYGIALNGINILADGNTIDTPYGAGFVTWHLYGECKGISITNNKVLGSQRTLSHGVDIKGYDISCINNLISNSGNYGIHINGIVRGTISTNTVINSDESGIRIVGASRDLLVENNKVIDNGSYGINIDSVTNLQLLDNQAFNSNTDNQNYGFIFIGTVIGTFKGNKAFSNISNNWLVSGGDLSGVDGDRVTIKLPDLAAGTSKEVPVMLVEGNGAYVVSSYLIPAVAIAQNDTDYCTFDIQDKGTGGTGTTSLCSAPQTTKSTGGVDFQDFVGTSLAINQNQTIVGGKVLSFKKTDSGSGQELDEAILVINYIAY